MNYSKIYNRLIDRALNRNIEGYAEKHHIVPRCMGGNDDADNLVKLTAREHYIAHMLLIKIYPKHYGLLKAAMMMTVCKSSNQERMTNRVYGWFRVRFAEAMRVTQTGTNNSQYGKIWIYNLELKKSKKVDPDELPTWEQQGWVKGRKLNFGQPKTKPKPPQLCKRCGEVTCLYPDICGKAQIVNTLISKFGFRKEYLGTEQFYDEYDRIVQMLYDTYHVSGLSTVEIGRKYGLSHQRVQSVFKSVGIDTRSLSDALLVNYRNIRTKSLEE